MVCPFAGETQSAAAFWLMIESATFFGASA
jgi:hypothetical protein